MSHEITPVTVRIMDKEFRVACSENEREALLESARFLDKKMREIRDSRKVIGTDRIAVMAALNIVHELLQSKSQLNSNNKAFNERIKDMHEKVESALHQNRQLDLK